MKYFSFPGRKIEVKKIKIERLRKNLKGEGICIDWGPELNADIWPFLFFQSKFCCRWALLSCRALQSKVSWSNWLHLIFVPGMIVYKFYKYFTNCFLFFCYIVNDLIFPGRKMEMISTKKISVNFGLKKVTVNLGQNQWKPPNPNVFRRNINVLSDKEK